MKPTPGAFPGFWTLLVVAKDGQRTWTVVEALVYATTVPEAPPSILVPAGTVTDFASVPRGLWNLFPPDGSYTPAAVVHDYLYRTGEVPRAVADAVFVEAMAVCGTGWFARTVIWASVRTFGWLGY
ncbi:MAG: DUF1353 domain-containing protein [Verrucomicrobiota bacterium]